MKCVIPEIAWHNRDPVYSVDLQPEPISRGEEETIYRLASGGTDSHVLIWHVKVPKDPKKGPAQVEFASDLHRHQRAVNVVRFSPSGEYLASGDDESVVMLWRQKLDGGATSDQLFLEDVAAGTEQWAMVKILRGHVEDVYDLCWSPDSQHLVSGSVDNTAIIWDVSKGQSEGILSDHKGFVQGVAWDPKNKYIATLSSDRVCRIFLVEKKRVVHRIYKSTLSDVDHNPDGAEMVHHLFHDDTFKSFFRRLSFTPDGELLIAPSGVMDIVRVMPRKSDINQAVKKRKKSKSKRDRASNINLKKEKPKVSKLGAEEPMDSSGKEPAKLKKKTKKTRKTKPENIKKVAGGDSSILMLSTETSKLEGSIPRASELEEEDDVEDEEEISEEEGEGSSSSCDLDEEEEGPVSPSSNRDEADWTSSSDSEEGEDNNSSLIQVDKEAKGEPKSSSSELKETANPLSLVDKGGVTPKTSSPKLKEEVLKPASPMPDDGEMTPRAVSPTSEAEEMTPKGSKPQEETETPKRSSPKSSSPKNKLKQSANPNKNNASYIFSRHNFNTPMVTLPTGVQYTIAVRCCPVLFELRTNCSKLGKSLEIDGKHKQQQTEVQEEKERKTTEDLPVWEQCNSLIPLPYRSVFAVATQDSVMLYDTQQPLPFGCVSNIHYTRLSDLAWSADGLVLVVSSTDGYCSIVTFLPGELGVPYNPPVPVAEPQPTPVAAKSDDVPMQQRPSNKNNMEVEEEEEEEEEIRLVLEDTLMEVEQSVDASSVTSTAVDVDSKHNFVNAEKTTDISETMRKMNLPVVSGQNGISTDSKTLNSHNEISPKRSDNIYLTPVKSAPDKVMTSPANETTPNRDLKRTPTPRRVSLITLSSPKSKKKIL